MSIDYTHEVELAQAYEQGRLDMLREVLADAGAFEAKMRKRRYFNNAAGVGRFADVLNDKLNQMLLGLKGRSA